MSKRIYLVEKFTAKYLRSRLTYDPQNGQLYYKPKFSGERLALWNGKNAGKPAGHFSTEGYVYVSIDGVSIAAHHVVWVMAFGKFEGTLDHRDRCRHNNTLANLRIATVTQQAQNSVRRRDNKSGVRGVWLTNNGRYRTSIKINRRTIDLGRYKTLEEAAAVRRDAEKRLFAEFSPV